MSSSPTTQALSESVATLSVFLLDYIKERKERAQRGYTRVSSL